MLRQGNVVVAVDSEYFLDDITFPRDIDHIARGGNKRTVLPLFEELVVEGSEDLYDHIIADLLPDKPVDTAVIKFNGLPFDLFRAGLLHLSDNVATGDLTDEKSRTLEGIFTDHRIGSPLETE